MTERPFHNVVLYTKEGCCLCERAREVIRRLQPDFDLAVKEIDITGRPSLFEQYRYKIPVMVIDGQHEFEPNKIAEHYIRRTLKGI